jgi:hypothetical protein
MVSYMSMHLLPAYWTTNNHKKRRKKKTLTKSMEKSLIEHEKFLKSVGYNPHHRRKPTPLKTEQSVVKLPEKNISDYDWSPCLKSKKSTLTKSYTIGQAYNKGNLVVLSNEESKDSNTGKRR